MGEGRRRIMRRLALFAAFLSMTAAAAAAAGPFGAIETLGGAPFAPAGHVTIVNYWATWCAPCRAEMPVLDAYYRKHRGQGLEMVAISLDDGASKAKLREATSGFAFAVARIDDVKMPRKDIPKALPVTRVYDRDGKLVYATKGDGRSTIDAATRERVVSPLLAAR